MNRKFIIIYLLLFSTFIFSCSRKTVPQADQKADAEAIANFEVQEIDFNYFTSKAKINYKDGGSEVNAIMNIRIKKNEIIWISLSHPLGIEGVRVLIKPDSIYVHDKINNTKTAYGLDFISQKFNVNLTFQNLQAILLGNLPMPRGEQDRLIDDVVSGFYQLHQTNGNIFVNNYIRQNNMKLEKLDLRDNGTGNTVIVNYEDFGILDNFTFPYRNSISGSIAVEGGFDNIYINIVHSKPEITDKELSFPFNMAH
ncbi:MAG: DUF4292 domain-containing protein [Cytophagaceae bacterium]